MKKSELIAALATLGDEDEVIVSIITPPDDEGFEENEGLDGTTAEASPDSNDDEDEDDDVEIITRDIDNVDVVLNEKDDDGVVRNVGFLIVDMTGDDEDDDEDDDGEEDVTN